MKKRVLSTQMPDQFNKLEKIIGERVDLINIPMIQIEPMDVNEELLETIKSSVYYTWIVFTSMRGVEHYFKLLDLAGMDKSSLSKIKFASIGESTDNELKKHGINCDYINPGSTSKEFATYLINEVLTPSDQVLLPLGNLAGDVLPEKLQEYCPTRRIDVYQTIGITKVPWDVIKMIDKDDYDLLVFTSPSAFENFIGIMGFHPIMKTLKIASIGARTNEKIEEEGFKSNLTASKPKIEVLAKEILEFLGVNTN